MYSITETENSKILVKLPQCRKIFTADGVRIIFGKKTSMSFPKDTIISVNKVNHWEMQKTRMLKARQVLSDKAWKEEKDLTGEVEDVIEEEILLSSLEPIEIL